MPCQALFRDDAIATLLAAAREAGALIMRHYRINTRVENKADASPVTEADKGADRLIVAALRRMAPEILIVSEEGDKPDVSHADYFWLVDPLDGTRSFIKGEGHFTVNIGLIEHSLPILGVVYDPAHDMLYWNNEHGAFRSAKSGPPETIRTRTHTRAAGGGTALISHRSIGPEMQAYLAAQGITERILVSSSLKFCLLAEGQADLYPRFGPTSEWDTAAGHAILNAAGGQMTMMSGDAFRYGKPDFLNGAFVAEGNQRRPTGFLER